MKILVTLYEINNYGGIINNNENLIAGFRELGHKVDFVEMIWKEKSMDKKTKFPDTYEVDKMGSRIKYNQEFGWLFPKENRIPYKGKKNIDRWKKFASKYDLILWQIPCPTKRKDHEGNSDWIKLYDLDVPQIAYVHDGNFAKLYPWFAVVRKHIIGVGCTNNCGYNTLKEIDIPRALIFSPQNTENCVEKVKWKKRRKGFFSLQNWKAWKHVDDLIRAVPYMDDDILKVFAGRGIEYHYMRSKNKCKTKYYVNKKYDPDCRKKDIGKRIWDLAEKNGMKHLGYIYNKKKVIALMRNLKCLVDPAWSISLSEVGEHYNRVSVEAMMQGMVPIARNLGVSSDIDGFGELMTPDENYVMVRHDASPKEFAEIVCDTVNMSQKRANSFFENNKRIVKLHDRKYIAEQFLKLAKKKPCGFYNKLKVGKLSDRVNKNAVHELVNFFKVKRR